MSENRPVLIAEDDPMSAEMLKEMLAMHGYESVWAATAKAVLAALTRGGHGAVLLDLTLPGMSMEEMLGHIALLRRPPVVIYSARPAAELAQAAERVSAVATLGKPVDMDELIAALDRAFAMPAQV